MLGIQNDIAQYFSSKWPLPLFGKDWKETETPQSPGVNYLTSLMFDHSILPSNPEKCLNNINSAGAPNLRSGVPCQGPIDCSTSLTKSRNLLSWYQECGRRSVVQTTQTTKVKQWLEQEKAKSMAQTLPKALRTQALTALTSNFGVVGLVQYAW